ncbi:hypothetical protein BE08_37765 [Sorangium cellulosum]|uniref:Transposase n=1 Tax=Sorangium cellulosum TaxID=56 RepID=A0A150P0I5_SORCE|nr:hypothetical protein BE08_37765 [Sorangium cellulosum]
MIPAGVQVFVALEPVDMRDGFERLSGLIRERVGYEARCGALFAFIGKRRSGVVHDAAAKPTPTPEQQRIAQLEADSQRQRASSWERAMRSRSFVAPTPVRSSSSSFSDVDCSWPRRSAPR